MAREKSYLVTGGCGFIGSHLVEALAEQGARVRVFDDLSTGYRKNIASILGAVEFVEGDIRRPSEIAAAMEGIDFVFHLAAMVSVFDSVQRPAVNHEINLTGTLNVLEAARAQGVKRVVLACTCAAYGNDPELPKRETMRPSPESPYAVGKVAGEYYARLYASLYGLPTVALRFFNVFGPRQDPGSSYSGVISKFVSVLRSGETPVVFGDGLQTRDFVFVKDVVQANLLAMAHPGVGAGEVLNVGTGRQTSLLELLSILGELTGRAATPEFREVRPGDVKHSVADISLARQRLGYAPHYSLRDGLKALIEYRD